MAGYASSTGIDGVAIGATTPSTGAFTTLSASGNVSVGSLTTPTWSVAGFATIEARGSSYGALIGVSTAASDADGVQLGQFFWADRNSTSGSVAVARVTASLKGSTANNRGSAMTFSTKKDGGALTDAIFIDNTQRVAMGLALSTSAFGGSPEYLTIRYDQSTNSALAIQNTTDGYPTNALTLWGHTGGYAGGLQITSVNTASFITASDSRLKTNLRGISDSGAIIDALTPRLFDWKAGAKDAYGFVAQEAYTVFPQMVNRGDDNPDKIERTWGIDPSKLVPVLTAEIKALRARVAALEAK